MALVTVACVGCGGSGGGSASEVSTTTPYVVDPLEPGQGFVELAGNRFAFDGVICGMGAAEGDPEGTARIFGVYANFELDGSRAGMELTRYHSAIRGEQDTVPTLTDVAAVRMQGDGEILGLEAKRFQVEGQRHWQDSNDPSATEPLITVEGDRYEVHAPFFAVGEAGTGGTPGVIAARCPTEGSGTVDSAPSTTSGDAATNTTDPGTTTLPVR